MESTVAIRNPPTGNSKTWRILHTDYCRPLKTFPETISTVIARHFYKIACE
ncbi:hypothetical protein [Winogradskya humida]|uniref:Uncharacterized protein n=1 Tax=Winogradskya humida TaxID=113566 RepID=A0ABQ3ZIK6_9ACTN|nr:hypothetical protein [Actinoplanes humidus]GIE18425.1 hypothetical protein Ahu01nite_015270 [Actinoplanes humidus]